MSTQGRRVAVMQPYFFPYAGYYRLLAAADYFVILDCVQFNRRGRVHRVQVPGHAGSVEWLTLPLKYQPRDVMIRDLAFSKNARSLLDQRLKCYSWIINGNGPMAEHMRNYLQGPLDSVNNFLADGIRITADALDLHPIILRSSELKISPELRAQHRIIAIVQALNGSEYINSPGGRHLYDSAAFADAGLHLSFLAPYKGGYPFLLPALFETEPRLIRADIFKTLQVSNL